MSACSGDLGARGGGEGISECKGTPKSVFSCALLGLTGCGLVCNMTQQRKEGWLLVQIRLSGSNETPPKYLGPRKMQVCPLSHTFCPPF